MPQTVEQPLVEKVQPQNLEAEAAALGSMMLSEEAVTIGMEMLKPASFYRESHQKIFQAMLDLFSKHEPIDLVTLTNRLSATGELEAVGGASYLASLPNVVPTSSSMAHYTKIVREKALLRSLIKSSTQIVEDCYSQQEEADQLLDHAEQLIFAITDKSYDSRAVLLQSMLHDTIEAIDQLRLRKKVVTGVATGFSDLDKMTAGLQPSDLVIVAGRPSMGKSALATCIAENVALGSDRVPVAVFSLEMSKEQLVHRMICSRAKVNAHNARTGFLSAEDFPRLTKAAGELSGGAPILIDDTAAISAIELRAKARRLKSQYDIGLIIVDYLQLMRGGAFRIENRQQEISQISQSLKALAKELKVPVIALSQLSRATELRDDKKPQLSDLRESGAIEQDADLVLFLFRPAVYAKDSESAKALQGQTELIVAKQRNGPIGTVDLTFLNEYTRFVSRSYQD